jgi:hypothetical protein
VGTNPFIRVIYHRIGGFASATNFIPFRGIKRWSWEIYQSYMPVPRLSRSMSLGISENYVSQVRCAAAKLWRDQQGESLGDNLDSDWQCPQ